jgi:hypothetical protein
MRFSAVWVALLLVALSATPGCDSAAPPPVRLEARSTWNDDPGSIDAIGYRVSVDVVWPTRLEDCFSLPADLTISLNDHPVVPEPMGDCAGSLTANFDAVAPDGPVDIRVVGGGHVYGEATYDDLFPGFGAQLSSASNNQLPAGGEVQVTLPATAVSVAADLFSAHFHWTDGISAVPFYTFALGKVGPDPQTVIITVPSTPTGPAQMIIKSVFFHDTIGSAKSCTGFTFCGSFPDMDSAGPISVQVTP